VSQSPCPSNSKQRREDGSGDDDGDYDGGGEDHVGANWRRVPVGRKVVPAPTRALSRFRGYRYAGVLRILSLHIDPSRARIPLGRALLRKNVNQRREAHAKMHLAATAMAGVPLWMKDP